MPPKSVLGIVGRGRRAAEAIAAVPGRLGALAVLLALSLTVALAPGLCERLRHAGSDAMQRLAPRGDEGLPAPIVAIDEASLARYGQWPWPRTLVARLVARIAEGRPRVLGVDIVFAEPDRLSPPRLADELPGLTADAKAALAGLPSGEAALADAFRTVPTVLGLDATYEAQPPTERLRVPLVLRVGPDPAPFLPNLPYVLASLPELRDAAAGAAALVSAADSDGTVRCVPLLVEAGGRLLPGLAVEMLTIASRTPPRLSAAADGVTGVTAAGIAVPTDRAGRACIRYSPSFAGRYVSAGDLLDGTVDPAVFGGKVVLLGLTGAGLLDVKQAPLAPVNGVEIHAQLIESILAGSLLREPPRAQGLALLLVVASGLVPIFLLPNRRPVLAGLCLGLLLAGLGGGALGLFLAGWLIDPLVPGLAAVATFGTMQAATIRAVEATRRRLAAELQREREAKARMEGELYVARAIQMGLLPHQFPGPPARPDVEIHAIVEPARMVGGDLFDFLFLDLRRLFFAVADVSGKGVPSALFMAMTKEVLRAAAVQHGAALDLALGEANAKIAAASMDMLAEGADMMFVTVFAGVLDLVGGTLVYATAGHDAPLLLHGLALDELASAGGPPLGATDDFAYPVETRQLAAGDMILMFTDGVTEAEDAGHGFYGAERLRRLVGNAPTASTRGLVEFVREDLRRFAAGAEQADDITLFALRWLGPPRRPRVSER